MSCGKRSFMQKASQLLINLSFYISLKYIPFFSIDNFESDPKNIFTNFLDNHLQISKKVITL